MLAHTKTKKSKRDNRRGFTIVELLIVIVIIGILAAITIVAYNGVQLRSKTSASKTTAATVVRKIEAYNMISGRYPSASLTNDLNSLQESNLGSITINNTIFGYVSIASQSPNNVKVDICTNPVNAGYRVYYWDYMNTDRPQTIQYGGSIDQNGNGCTGWSAAT